MVEKKNSNYNEKIICIIFPIVYFFCELKKEDKDSPQQELWKIAEMPKQFEFTAVLYSL